MEPEKKISFGFSKLSKKPQLLSKKPQDENKVELIESFEENAIKVKNAVEEIVKQPLVIPIKDNQKNILDRIRNSRNQAKENAKEQAEVEDTRPDSELTLDELAAREVINDAKRRLEQTTTASKVFVLPMKEDKITEGEPESTLEDYENIPISDYGMAMLRGMGWKEGTAIGKNQTKSGKLAEAPELRPKGLGLGASKLVKAEANSTTVRDKDGQELVLKRGALAKIIAGASKGNYCEVQGLDDEAGRVIVKTALKGEILTLHEFLVILVTKEEYARNSKILNTAKYEEYKQKETIQNSRESEVKIKSERNDFYDRVKTEKSEEHSRSKTSQRHKANSDSESDDDTTNSRYADNDSRSRRQVEENRSRRQSPGRGHGSRQKSRSKERSSKRNGKSHKKDDSDSDLSSDSEYERRKKHHKKKDKRSRRDRSRSPKKKSSKKSRRQSSSPDSAYEETYSSRSKSKRERSRSGRRKHSSRRSSS